MRAILDSDPRRHVIPLLLLSGLAASVAPQPYQPWGIVGAIALAVVGVPIVWVIALAFAWSGRLLGGTGDAVAVRAAIAWARMPAILAAILRLALLATFGRDALDDGFLGGVASRFLDLADLWVLALGLITLAEAHRFSVIRAFGASVLGSLLFVLPLAIAVLIAGTTGLWDPQELVN
jgi:hypothetical protein